MLTEKLALVHGRMLETATVAMLTVWLVSGCSDSSEKCENVMHPGVCGLLGMQVECIQDEHCCENKRCLENGLCGSDEECEKSDECPSGQICSSRGHCTTVCESDAECPVGHACARSACEHLVCGPEGDCPQNWEYVPGTLQCWPVGACPEGTIEGKCGLVGECVECNTDSDCESGERCTDLGECVAWVPCGDDDTCSTYDECGGDGLCRQRCFLQSECEARSLCVEGDYCFAERCNDSGSCKEGWSPIPGTLACGIESCTVFGFHEGACGMEGRCVDCVADADCEGELRCAEDGAVCSYIEDACDVNNDCKMLHERAICDNSQCEIPCDSIVNCPYGWICENGYCRTRSCGQDGICPADWSPIEGSLGCWYDPCSSVGQLPGACGLSGRCVECNVDEQCGQGICDDVGRCADGDCATDADCPADHRCVGRRCALDCSGDSDCGMGKVCDESSGVCVTVRCDESGWCSLWGWQPVAGSLSCEYRPCYWEPEKMPGVCGLSQQCVSCIEDLDCPVEEYCDRWGHCEPFHDCDDPMGSGCANFQTCKNSRCEIACLESADCGDAGTCDGGGACNFVRCARDGTCPPGWHVPGPSGSLGLVCLPD